MNTHEYIEWKWWEYVMVGFLSIIFPPFAFLWIMQRIAEKNGEEK